jgi:hypothetical protein
MSPQELDALRKEIRKRMVDLDLPIRGAYDIVLPALNERLARLARNPISRSILSMAMTSYREGESYIEILKELQALLAEWPVKGDGACINTREGDEKQ